ncbi:MAG: hypothetical protein NVSMB16_03800 [Acidimicrobiales bacterium]
MSEPSSFYSADEIETMLAAAMVPSRVAPPPASVAALRAAAYDRRRAVARAAVGPTLRWRRKAVLIAALVGSGTVGSAGVAFAHPVLPVALRQVASAVGLPVDSQPVADVRSDSQELRRALERGDVARVGRDLRDLDRSEARLAPGDHARMVGALEKLEEEARALSPSVTAARPVVPDATETDDGAPPPAPEHAVGKVDGRDRSAPPGDAGDGQRPGAGPVDSSAGVGATPAPPDVAHVDTASSERPVVVQENAADEAAPESPPADAVTDRGP